MNLFEQLLFSKKQNKSQNSIENYNFKKDNISYEEQVFQRAAKYILKNITFSSPKEIDLMNKKIFSSEKYQKLTILSANPNGITNFSGLDDGKYCFVGIANGKLFTITKNLREIEFIKLEDMEECGPHGDFINEINLLYNPHNNYNDIRINSQKYIIQENGNFTYHNNLKFTYYTNVNESSNKEKVTEYLNIAETVRKKLKIKELNNQQEMEM